MNDESNGPAVIQWMTIAVMAEVTLALWIWRVL